MIAYVAFLRAVNVGGTGKLPMAEWKSMCEVSGSLICAHLLQLVTWFLKRQCSQILRRN